MSKRAIQYITNASSQSGVGHQAVEIARRLKSMADISLTEWQIDGENKKLLKDGSEITTVRSWPGMLGSKSVNWLRLGQKLKTQNVQGKTDEPLLWHFTNQTLSFLAKRLSPSIVTVHDLIELLEPQDWRAQWLNAYLYGGITKANHIICVSEYTKKTVQEHCNVPAEKITVIHNGVGPEFHPLPQFSNTIAGQELRRELKLSSDAKVVLYVGSDHPRKGGLTAVRALAAAAAQLDVPLVFLKVGKPGLPAGRARLLEEIERLHLAESVRFIDSVSDERLNELYNLADVFVFPSRLEGFGLPPLQAMAAGVPVIAAKASSLPEVIAQAGLWHEVDDDATLAQLLVQAITDQPLAAKLKSAGLERARNFSWDTAAQKTAEVYRTVADSVG